VTAPPEGSYPQPYDPRRGTVVTDGEPDELVPPPGPLTADRVFPLIPKSVDGAVRRLRGR
jgi:hypothetical protein